MKRTFGTIVCVGLLAAPLAAQVRPREVADDDIDRVIGEIQSYIAGQQNLKTGQWHYWYHRMVPQEGPTALATFALLDSGVLPTDPAVKAGLDALKAFKSNNLYVRAFRAMAFSLAYQRKQDPAYVPPIKEDIEWLTKKAISTGAWGYGGAEADGDNSCSQIALLALWEAERAGLTLNAALVRRVEAVWKKRQRKDGGWTYAGQPNVDSDSTVSMTAAALASLYICWDITTLQSGPYRYEKEMNEGWDNLIKTLPKDFIDFDPRNREDLAKNGYLAFVIQRLGMASGRKFIGDLDWFQSGAGILCKPDPRGRQFAGPWGPVVRACFELIFLSRGRIPLTYNKLRYGPTEVTWNYHNRDVARFTEYMRRNFETRMRWQVVDVVDDVTEMLDAPILLVAGQAELNLSEEQWGKLRDYTLRGGTAVFVPFGGGAAKFVDSVKEQLDKLYVDQRAVAGGGYELSALGGDHPLYSAHQKITQGDKRLPMWGVSDGTRLLAIVSERDICESWQKGDRGTRGMGEMDHYIGANLFFYATGANPNIRSRLRPVFRAHGREVRHRLNVGWVRHNANWCTQPYGLKYVADKLMTEEMATIDLKVGVDLTPQGLKNQQMLWMTGSRKLTLTDAEITALRDWINQGGLIFIDAVGGSTGFYRSAQLMLDKLFNDGSVASGLIAPGSPIVTGRCGKFLGPKLDAKSLPRTLPWRSMDINDPELQLRIYEKDGRTLAIFCRYGIHDTLDGHSAFDAQSYLPAAARNIAANIFRFAMANTKIKPTALNPMPGADPDAEPNPAPPGEAGPATDPNTRAADPPAK